MTLTKKDLFLVEYQNFQNIIKNYINYNGNDSDLFPDVNDMEISDIIYYIKMYFTEDSDIRFQQTVKDLMYLKGISLINTEYEHVLMNHIMQFVELVKLNF